MAADFGEGDFDRPATHEPAEDVERVGIKVGAEKCLRFEFAHWIAHQDITDGNAVAGMVPYGGAGDDLDQQGIRFTPVDPGDGSGGACDKGYLVQLRATAKD